MSVNVEDLDGIAAEIRQRISAAADQPALEQLRIEALGKKGRLTAALRTVGTLPAGQRAAAGARANALKGEIETLLTERAPSLPAASLETLGDRERVDVSVVPGAVRRGHLHPLTLILREVKAIFSRLGYEVALGPQVEDEFHNFEALNIPAEHPARDTMDSFYVEGQQWLLRTHTSPVQIRYMQSHKPPIRIIAPGPVYRRGAPDPSRGPQCNPFDGPRGAHVLGPSELRS